MLLEQSVAATIVFAMRDDTDFFTPETGKSPDCEISKNAGAFASTTNSASEISDGWYTVTLTTTETNTVGPLIFKATSAGCAQMDEVHQVYDELNADVTTNSDKTDYTLSATGVDEVLDETIQAGGPTLREAMIYVLGFAAGKLTLDTNEITIRDTEDTTDIIVATVDANGQRTSVTLTAP